MRRNRALREGLLRLGFKHMGHAYILNHGIGCIGVEEWSSISGVSDHYVVHVDKKEIFLGFLMDIGDLKIVLKREGVLL